MLFFGHVGLTLGVALVARKIALPERNSVRRQGGEPAVKEPDVKADEVPSSLSRGLFDLRWWAVGSILPDIIDKPLYLLNSTIASSRVFSHTLVFALLLFGAGLALALLKSRGGLLALSFGTFMHLVLDFIWRTPETLWWPLYGTGFPAYDRSVWLEQVYRGMVGNPVVYVGEVIGLVITIGLAWKLIREKHVLRFIRHGEWPGNLGL